MRSALHDTTFWSDDFSKIQVASNSDQHFVYMSIKVLETKGSISNPFTVISEWSARPLSKSGRDPQAFKSHEKIAASGQIPSDCINFGEKLVNAPSKSPCSAFPAINPIHGTISRTRIVCDSMQRKRCV